MCGVPAGDDAQVVPPNVEQLLQVGRDLLEESRRLTESLDAQLRKGATAGEPAPEPEPA